MSCAASVAEAIDSFCRREGIAATSIDGPQAWRDPTSTRRGVGRSCEFETKTPGKTGPHGTCFPGTYIKWVTFSIDVFAELLRLGHAQLANDGLAVVLEPRPAGEYWLLECFPSSTWRTLGLLALPGHAKASVLTVEAFANALRDRLGLPDFDASPDHDALQAVVAALPAAALLGARLRAVARGESSRHSTGVGSHRLEGLIWDAGPEVTGEVAQDST